MQPQLIDAAYQVSSARVLSLLTEQNHLMQRLTSVKHYFLLDRGDWFIHFMDIAHEELCKDVKNVNQVSPLPPTRRSVGCFACLGQEAVWIRSARSGLRVSLIASVYVAES